MEKLLFLIADYANTESSGKLNILGAFNEIRAKSFPTTHPLMFVVIKLGAELGEFGIERQFKVLFLNEDGVEQGSAPGSFIVPQPTGSRRAEINLIIGIRDLVFEKPGRYEFRLLLNDDLKGEISLDVIQAEQPSV